MSADLVIKNGWVVTPTDTFKGGVAIKDGKFVAVGTDDVLPKDTEEIDAKGRHILPGIIDGHVHFRVPGLEYKEDFTTGSTAAVCGGVTMVMDMPNVVPPTADADRVREKIKLAEGNFLCDYAFFGVVVQTNTDQILPMAEAGVIGYKIFFGETIGNLPFPDDGMCMEAFANITQSKLPLGIHAENRQIMAYYTNKLKAEGKNDPVYWEASRPDICEAESVAHAIFLAETFKTKLHVYHMSSKQAAQLVRDARARGLRVTAETGPHYLLREPKDMAKVGSLLKMNPPVRSRDHAEALWDGLLSGHIDMIATDHSPHTLEEKGSDLMGKLTKPAIWECISGFCGVETGVPLLLNEVNKGRMTLNHYVKLTSENPAKVWQIYPQKGAIRPGSDGDVTIVDMDKEGTIDVNKLHSKNKPSPWHGWKVKGMPVATIVRGHVQMRDGEPVGKPVGKLVRPKPA
ncbi:MAG: dihydroorotase family protein [Deltaproteobacteria bacterium]|nr:dihydroorotase family protein [Deltaproteobacteria bacterium]